MHLMTEESSSTRLDGELCNLCCKPDLSLEQKTPCNKWLWRKLFMQDDSFKGLKNRIYINQVHFLSCMRLIRL